MAIRNKEKPETALQEAYWKFWDGFNTYTLTTTTLQEHGGDSVERHEAGDDCAPWSVEERVPI